MATDIKNDATLSTSLVSVWLSDESGLLTDLVTATGNDLTDVNTVTLTSLKQGDAGDFESGTSEHLKITDGDQSNLDITGNFTIACWFKVESFAGDRTVAAKWTTAGSNRQYRVMLLDATNVRIDTSTDGSGSTEGTIGTSTMSAGTTYHGIWTKTSTTGEFFLDGVSQGTVTVDSAQADKFGDFTIGSIGNPANYFDGIINQVCIWSKALSSGEISDLYNSGTGIPYEAAASTFTSKMMILL